VHGVETAVLVPIKAFRDAKGRLAGAYRPDERVRLAQAMAARVIAAAAPFDAFVACDDDHVANWATERGAQVLWTPGLGLNGAIEHGVELIAGKGFDHVVVSHGDLPLAETFAHVCEPDVVTLVPDHRLDGTNVQARPASGFTARYGAGSFRAHLVDALTDGLAVRVVIDAQLATDIDTVDDLERSGDHDLVARLLAEAHPAASEVGR
jgi:2-phospho-L-lactate guanylyltransferase